MKNLTNKKVLITAAGQGIGRAATLAFKVAGAKVLATDINEKSLSTLSEEGITTNLLDVCNSLAIGKLVESCGPFDILFNCAGTVHSGTLLEMSKEDLSNALNLNVIAMADVARAVLPGMINSGSGVILNMSSVASSIKGVPNRAAYSISKAAVIGLTKSIAADYTSKGIRCNAICPGTVDSPSLQERLKAAGDYEQARQDFIARQPMGRIGTTQEIAELVIYLSSASFTTGQTYLIDGGWTI